VADVRDPKRTEADADIDDHFDAPGGSPSPFPAQRTAGALVVGAGVVALAVGTFLGVRAKSTYDDTNSHCNASVCDAEGVRLTDQAKSSATGATIAFVAGAAALAGGVTLMLTSRRDSAVSVVPGPRGASLSLTKTF
jgi:hypothetical protein